MVNFGSECVKEDIFYHYPTKFPYLCFTIVCFHIQNKKLYVFNP
jgi:hypothetical protein